MAKKRSSKKSSINLIKKGITLLASVLVFVFLFLEVLAIKSKGSLLGKESDTATTSVKFSEILFNEDYEIVREELGLTAIILWATFILVILSIATSLLSLIAKKQGTSLAKLGGGLLVVSMVILFAINLDKAEFSLGGFASSTTWISNMTSLYFVSLVTSIVGLGSALTLKK